MKSKKNKPVSVKPLPKPAAKRFDLLTWDLPIPDIWLMAGLFLLALGIKFICLGQYTASPDFLLPVGDSEMYLNQARQILDGGRWLGTEVPFITPLYPLFIALGLKLFHESVFAVHVLQIIVGAAGCVLVYALARRVAKGYRAAALLAGLFTLGYGVLTFLDIDLLGIFMTLVTLELSMLLLIKTQETPKAWWAIFGGVAFGLAVLERANLLLFIPVALWYLAGRFSLEVKRIKHWPWKPASGFLLGVLLMILPVTINNYLVSRDFVLITNNAGVNLFIGNNPRADGTLQVPPNSGLTNTQEMGQTGHGMARSAQAAAEKELGRKLKPSEVSRYWSRKAGQFIISEPARAMKLYLRKLQLLLNDTELPNHLSYDYMRHEMIPSLQWLFLGFGIILPLAAVGIWSRFRQGLTDTDKLLASFILVYALSLLPFFITDRYRLPLVPFLIIFAAVGAVETLRLLLARSWRDLAWLGAVLLIAGWAANQSMPFRLTYGHSRVTLGDRYSDRADLVPRPGNPDLIQAILEYKQTIEVSPNYVMAYIRLARAYEVVGYYSENLKLLAHIERLDPSQREPNAAIRANIVNLYNHGGDLVSEKDIPKTPFEKALLDEEQGESERALEKYTDIIARDPFHVQAYSHLGTLLLKRGETSQAIEIFKNGLDCNPNNPVLLDNLSDAYYQSGNQSGYNRIRARIAELQRGAE
jgi:tetratricopeptide (TPR) repeat protein